MTNNTTFRLYFLKEIVLTHFESLFMVYSEKMKGKYMKEDVWGSFFVNLYFGISELH